MSRRAKRDVIVIDDDDDKSEQPVEKIVKNEEPVDHHIVAELQQKLIESDGKLAKSDQKFKRVCEMAGEHKARAEFLEDLIDKKGKMKEEAMDEKVSDLNKQLEAEREARARDSERIAQLTNQLEEERKGRMEDSERVSKLTNQLEEEKKGRKAEREKAQEYKLQAEILKDLMDSKVHLYESLRDSAAPSPSTADKTTETDSMPQFNGCDVGIQSDPVAAGVDMAVDGFTDGFEDSAPIDNAPVEVNIDSSIETSIGQPGQDELPIVDNFMGESLFGETNFMEDPMTDDHHSIPIEENSLNNLPSNGENKNDSAETEMIGEANDSMEDEVEKDETANNTSDTAKDSSETGKVEKKIRPTRSLSKPVNYNESLRIKSQKEIANIGKSAVGESSSKQSTKGDDLTKINYSELKCPNCEYRSRSVQGWYKHLLNIHSTNPHELGLALHCECGHLSVSDKHSRSCAVSKITVVHKNPTPQCVMCEAYPKSARSYAQHIQLHHKTTLKKMGLFLICSCGYKLRSPKLNPEHGKKCHGHAYKLHKLDEE